MRQRRCGLAARARTILIHDVKQPRSALSGGRRDDRGGRCEPGFASFEARLLAQSSTSG